MYGNGGGFAANRDTATGAGEVILKSSILFNNSATASGDQIAVGPNGDDVTTISFCDVEGGLNGVAGTEGTDFTWGDGNFDEDPRFHNPGSDDFRLDFDSPCLNNGDPSDIPTDAADLNNDTCTDETIPIDSRGQTRQVNSTSCIDVGATENQQAGTAGCPSDITGIHGVPDGEVDDYDLDLVTNRWGLAGGIADLYPTTCGDSTVDTDDLLEVINNWGSCSGNAPSGGLPEWLQGCIDDCGEDMECLVDCIMKHFDE